MGFPSEHPIPSRASALRVICPRCKAQPGEPCVGSRVPPQPRKAVHRQRLDVIVRLRQSGDAGSSGSMPVPEQSSQCPSETEPPRPPH